MAIKVGINGFGRIGRQVMRIMNQSPEKFEVVAIHDLAPVASLVHLLKYDTVYGRYDGTVEVVNSNMVVDGKEVNVIDTKCGPSDIDWGTDIDVVVESTGIFRTKKSGDKDGYDGHIGVNGCKKVLLSVPAKDEIDCMVVLGVNDDALDKDAQTISNASCTTNCLSPVAKVLNDEFGIEHGMMTTIHAYTGDQNVSDQIHSDLRRARAGAMNVIPTTTGAAIAVGKIIPELDGKLNGGALRVPVITGSLVDLTVKLKKSVTKEEVNASIKTAAEGSMKGILEYTEDPIVSSDIIGNPHSSIFDGLSTMVMEGDMVKIITWYDNEWGYSNRVCELIEKAMKID
ncbi:MAG: type I glyceraldehyde-3-phosphate dehydrogenase [Verrucomicrobiota bacterium]|nr:type I glyceraldehyde-3-phosphate dehydrogenase [Verrucomicrobiota bacterium]